MKDEWRPMKDAPKDRPVRLLYTPPNWTTATEVLGRYIGDGAWAATSRNGSTGGTILDPQGWKPIE